MQAGTPGYLAYMLGMSAGNTANATGHLAAAEELAAGGSGAGYVAIGQALDDAGPSGDGPALPVLLPTPPAHSTSSSGGALDSSGRATDPTGDAGYYTGPDGLPVWYILGSVAAADPSTGNDSDTLGGGSNSRVSIDGGPGNRNESIRTLEFRPGDAAAGGVTTLEVRPGDTGNAGVANMFVFAPLVVAAPAIVEAVVAVGAGAGVAAGVGGGTGAVVIVGTGTAATVTAAIVASRNGLPFEGAATIDARERNEMSRLFWDWMLGAPDRQPAAPVGEVRGAGSGTDQAPSPTPQANPATGGAAGGSEPPEKPPGNTLPPPPGPEDGKGDDKTPPEGFKDAEEAAKAARGEPLGRGSTGKSAPADLRQQVALEVTQANPAAGKQLPIPMTDPRWPGTSGWVKMTQNINGVEIHYVRNTRNGAVDDFKFK